MILLVPVSPGNPSPHFGIQKPFFPSASVSSDFCNMDYLVFTYLPRLDLQPARCFFKSKLGTCGHKVPKVFFICVWREGRSGGAGTPGASVLVRTVSCLQAHLSDTPDVFANPRDASSELNGLRVYPLLCQVRLHYRGRKGGTEGRIEASRKGKSRLGISPSFLPLGKPGCDIGDCCQLKKKKSAT